MKLPESVSRTFWKNARQKSPRTRTQNLRIRMAQAAHDIARPTAPPFRPVRLGPRDFIIDRKPDGTIYLSSPHRLPAYPKTITQCLVNWAERTPDTVYMADRVDGAWRKTTYADTLARVRRIGTALLKRKLSAESPVAVLSGNELEHHWLGLAAMHIGVPYSPVSPAYSLISS